MVVLWHNYHVDLILHISIYCGRKKKQFFIILTVKNINEETTKKFETRIEWLNGETRHREMIATVKKNWILVFELNQKRISCYRMQKWTNSVLFFFFHLLVLRFHFGYKIFISRIFLWALTKTTHKGVWLKKNNEKKTEHSSSILAFLALKFVTRFRDQTISHVAASFRLLLFSKFDFFLKVHLRFRFCGMITVAYRFFFVQVILL